MLEITGQRKHLIKQHFSPCLVHVQHHTCLWFWLIRACETLIFFSGQFVASSFKSSGENVPAFELPLSMFKWAWQTQAYSFSCIVCLLLRPLHLSPLCLSVSDSLKWIVHSQSHTYRSVDRKTCVPPLGALVAPPAVFASSPWCLSGFSSQSTSPLHRHTLGGKRNT